MPINIYKIAIISNLPNIIFIDNTNLEMSSKTIIAIPMGNPIFEMIEADSNSIYKTSVIKKANNEGRCKRHYNK